MLADSVLQNHSELCSQSVQFAVRFKVSTDACEVFFQIYQLLSSDNYLNLNLFIVRICLGIGNLNWRFLFFVEQRGKFFQRFYSFYFPTFVIVSN